jgi:hypothetical protein
MSVLMTEILNLSKKVMSSEAKVKHLMKIIKKITSLTQHLCVKTVFTDPRNNQIHIFFIPLYTIANGKKYQV